MCSESVEYWHWDLDYFVNLARSAQCAPLSDIHCLSQWRWDKLSFYGDYQSYSIKETRAACIRVLQDRRLWKSYVNVVLGFCSSPLLRVRIYTLRMRHRCLICNHECRHKFFLAIAIISSGDSDSDSWTELFNSHPCAFISAIVKKWSGAVLFPQEKPQLFTSSTK